MKVFMKFCSLFCFVCWASLCLAAATGAIEVEVVDYCLATGFLASKFIIDLVM